MSSAIGNGGVFASFSSRISRARDLDLAGRDLRVHRLRRARLDVPEDRDRRTPGAAASRQADERLVVAHDDLRDAVAVADVDEDERAEVADAVHPAEQDDVLADVGGRQRAAGVGAREGSEGFDVHGHRGSMAVPGSESLGRAMRGRGYVGARDRLSARRSACS